MVYNILNGDSLASGFSETMLEGEVIVVREALIDGNLSGDNLHNFWQSRAKYLGLTEAEYHNNVVAEFEKLINAPADSEFNLWFEYDLFCQVNMWFVISVINSLAIKRKVYAVYSSHLARNSEQFWNGFGPAKPAELIVCFQNRISLNDADLQFGQDLWAAYKNGDLHKLGRLANAWFPAFPYLQEVIKAHIDRFPKDGSKGRPQRVLEDIIKNVSPDFHEVLKEFWKRESIYGFGDTQVQRIYEEIMPRS
ncbi:MAG TPA: hypothetical protein VGC95_06785 [Chitinophagaceae bacterium]